MCKIAYLTLLSFMLFSCVAYQEGSTTAYTASENVIYNDLAIGTSQTNRILGFGGIRKDALLFEAKRQMITTRPLEAGEEYQNITIDVKHSFIILLHRTKVTMTADVVKHVSEEVNERYSAQYKEKVFINNHSDSLFQVGRIVVFENGKEGMVLQNKNSKKSIVQFKNRHGEIVTRKMSQNKIFTTIGNWKGFKVGDSFLIKESFSEPSIQVTLIGISKNRALIRDPMGIVYSVKFQTAEIISKN